MYNNAKSCVKLPGGVTKSFKLEKGINEGDTVSPYLFNLYLNDINQIFTSQEYCPPSLGEHEVKCLLYTDDLLILSETAQGLQNALNRLNIYCKTWRLQMNIKKTKVMIFNLLKIKKIVLYCQIVSVSGSSINESFNLSIVLHSFNLSIVTAQQSHLMNPISLVGDCCPLFSNLTLETFISLGGEHVSGT